MPSISLTFVLGPLPFLSRSRSRSPSLHELPLDTLVAAVDTLRTLPAYRLHPLERQLLLVELVTVDTLRMLGVALFRPLVYVLFEGEGDRG